jgi:hypothetical protein
MPDRVKSSSHLDERSGREIILRFSLKRSSKADRG